jgi:hypothetical protein
VVSVYAELISEGYNFPQELDRQLNSDIVGKNAKERGKE